MPRSIRSLPRLVRTVRHLSSRQIIGQLRQRLRSFTGDRLARWADKQSPEPMTPRWSPVTDFLPPPQGELDAEAIKRGALTMLNQTHQVGYPPQWDYADAPRLWQYNLHYMDYLWALSAGDARAVVLDYIDKHTPQRGHCGWEPYPLSLRLMNWCALLYGRDREATLADEAGHAKISATIRLMANWLIRNPETHILANHLLENYLALALAGNCFHTTDAEVAAGNNKSDQNIWWHFGLEGTKSELFEQVLADGGHFERSPMYQCRLLCGLLWLLNEQEEFYLSSPSRIAPQMANHLAAMTHPDGEIALFNDAALGIYNTPGELFDFAERLGIEVDRDASSRTAWLADSGYAVGGSRPGQDKVEDRHSCLSAGQRPDLEDDPKDDSASPIDRQECLSPCPKLSPHPNKPDMSGATSGGGHRFIMDAGDLAPAYQPGHAHADLLSFELSLFGKRLIIDAGNHDYENSKMRAYCRGVAAHNTIEINGQDQCELWSAFRVGRRAYPRDVAVEIDESTGNLSVSASHNGYDHLPGKPRHTRVAKWYPQGVLLVEDRVESAEEVDVVSRLRLGEGWTLRAANVGHFELAHGADVATIRLFGETAWEVEDGWNCPRFYDQRPCRVLTCRTRGRSVRLGFCIAAGKIDGVSPFEHVQIGGTTYAW